MTFRQRRRFVLRFSELWYRVVWYVGFNISKIFNFFCFLLDSGNTDFCKTLATTCKATSLNDPENENMYLKLLTASVLSCCWTCYKPYREIALYLPSCLNLAFGSQLSFSCPGCFACGKRRTLPTLWIGRGGGEMQKSLDFWIREKFLVPASVPFINFISIFQF